MLPATAFGQQDVAGRVVDPQGQPVPNLPIVLHGVTETGGAPLADAVTNDSGRFAIRDFDPPADLRLLFVSARWNGQVYLGPALQPGADASGYVLEVGGVSAEDMLAQAPPSAVANGGRSYGALLVFLPLVAAIVLLWRALRTDAGHKRRVALRDLARMEEEAAARPDDPVRRAELQALRDSLLTGSMRTAG